jgi:hypothetical protein
VNYIQAVEQLTATMLRSVIGSMDLEQALTSRDKINTMLRGVLDDASGKWGIRVTRVEIKAIDPPQSVKDAMEKQMRAEREKRAAILTAEGVRQSQILTADGDKQGNILRAEGEKQGAILRAEGQAQAIGAVFQSIHDNDPDPKLLAYQYLQTLPQLAQGPGNTVWMVPSELTSALKMLSSAFEGAGGGRDAAAENSQGALGQLPRPRRPEVPRPAGPAQVEAAPDDAAPASAGAEATANGTVPASAGAATSANGTDPASAGAGAAPAGVGAEAAGAGGGAGAGAGAEAASELASAEAAGAVAAADTELAAAVREAAEGAG